MMNNKLKLFIFAALCAGVWIVSPGAARAAIPDGVMPDDVRNYLENCGFTRNSAAQTGWVSLRGNPTVRVVSVDYGQGTVDLQYNVAGYVCDASRLGGLQSTTNGIISTSPAIPGLTGQTLTYVYPPRTGEVAIASLPFSYGPPGGYVASGAYSLQITEKRINTYGVSPRYRCVTNPGDVNYRTPTSSTDFAACRSVGQPVFEYYVEVGPRNQLPGGVITANCDASGRLTVAVSASDPDGGNVSVTLAIPGVGTVSGSGSGAIPLSPSGPFAGQPQDGLDRAIAGTVYDAQTGEARALSGGGYRCAVPAPEVSCSLPGSSYNLETGEAFTAQVNVRNRGPGAPPVVVSATAVVDGNASLRRTATARVGTENDVTIDFPPPYALPLGAHTLSVALTWVSDPAGFSGGPLDCGSAVLQIANKPYVKVFGGDALVGAAANDCSLPLGSGRVIGFLEGSANAPKGMGVQFALQALGEVNGATSSLTNTAATPLGAALTFANTGSLGYPDSLGGNFGAAPCIPDYYGRTKQPTPGAYTSSTGDIASLAAASIEGQVEHIGDLTIRGGALAAGQRLAVYVSGDVYLDGAITMEQNYVSTAQIPFFALIVRGNIFISASTPQLDGMYVAQPVGSGSGTVYTCAAGLQTLYPTAGPSGSTLHQRCSSRLTVNGSVIAKRLKLLRTNGTIGASSVSDTALSDNIAEVFNGLPELYLTGNPFRIDPVRSSQYDNAASLPPIL